MKALEIANLLEELSPPTYACSWDNVGMHVGRSDNEVNKILVCLDIDDMAVEQAISLGVDMIVSHHPLIFKGIKKINEKDIIGRRIISLIENKINAFCMHTNFDSVGGMAEYSAELMELKEPEVLSEVCLGEGIGRVGNLSEPMTVIDICEKVKRVFGLPKVILFGEENATVSRIAICPGSGKEEIDTALQKGAEVIITGDVSYHYGIDSVAKGINVIDAGHYGIEHIFIDRVAEYLSDKTEGVEIIKMEIINPQKYI